MVCDDDQGVCEMLEYVLTSNGIAVVVVTGAEEGLRRLKQGGIDLVLMDRMMPGMLGEDALQAIKAHETTRAIPVVMLTSADDMGTISHCLKLGAAEFVTKPVHLQLLLSVIAKLLPENGKLAAARSRPSTPLPGRVDPDPLKRDVLRMVEALAPILAELNRRYEGAVAQSPKEAALREAGIRVSEIQLLLEELKAIVDPKADS